MTEKIMRPKFVAHRCNATGGDMYEDGHTEICLDCRQRIWNREHPILLKVKYISFGVLAFLGMIGFFMAAIYS